MSAWDTLRLPTQMDLLIGFYDLTGYTKFSASHEPLEVLEILSGYFALTGGIIREAGGKLIKTLGDAGLCAFADPDAGVNALMRVQREGEAWLMQRGYKARTLVKVNHGPVAVGIVAGVPDVYGKTVNTAAVLPSDGMALTAAAFRALKPETRALFKKHTPPVSYIAVEDRRP